MLRSLILLFLIIVLVHGWPGDNQDTCEVVTLSKLYKDNLSQLSAKLNSFLDQNNLETGHESMKNALLDLGLDLKVDQSAPLLSYLIQYQKIIHDDLKKTNEKLDDHIKNLQSWIKNIILRPSDCLEIFRGGERKSGVYTIYPKGTTYSSGIKAYCDLNTDDGGWTAFLNGQDYNNNNFWQSNKDRFDNTPSDYWMGSCKNKCVQDPNCVIAYWKPVNDYFLCKLQTDVEIPLRFTYGVHFYCKGCIVNRGEINRGLASGSIHLENIALNKRTEALTEYHHTNTHLISRQAVDGNYVTRFASKGGTNKAWLMIDLGAEYLVTQIRLTGILADRIGQLKIYLGKTYNRSPDFSTYPMILHVPGNAASKSESYNLHNIISGRYIVVQRQSSISHLDISEIEIYTPVIV